MVPDDHTNVALRLVEHSAVLCSAPAHSAIFTSFAVMTCLVVQARWYARYGYTPHLAQD